MNVVQWRETGAESRAAWNRRAEATAWAFIEDHPDIGLEAALSGMPVPVMWCEPCDQLQVPFDLDDPCSTCSGETRPAVLVTVEARAS